MRRPPLFINAPPLPQNIVGDFFSRLYHNYADEFGKATPVSDPNAPPSRRPESVMAPAPVTSPPYPFGDWAGRRRQHDWRDTPEFHRHAASIGPPAAHHRGGQVPAGPPHSDLRLG